MKESAKPFWRQKCDDKEYCERNFLDYYKFYVAAYGPVHEHYNNIKYDDNPAEGKPLYTRGSSPGAGLQEFGFKTKAEFREHPQCPYWLELDEFYGPGCNWIHPYTASPKNENTPVKNIDNHKCRVFYIADAYDDYIGAKYCMNYNRAVKACAYNKLTQSLVHGCVKELRDEMERHISCHPDNVIEESDCSKYDHTMIQFYFDVQRMLRTLLAPAHLPRTEIILKRFYFNMQVKFLIWLDGEMIKCVQGLPSGCRVTSEDNTQTHHHTRWDYYKSFGYSDEFICFHILLWLVSDDSLISAPKETVDADLLAKHYAQWGRIWKEMVTNPSRSMDGKTFCGITWLPNGRYVIARDKCMHALSRLHGRPPREIQNAAESLAFNLWANPVDYKIFKEFAYERAGVVLNDAKIRLAAEGVKL